MNILNRIKLNKLHSFTAILLVIVLLLATYNFSILLPNQRKAGEEINRLKNEVARLQLELDKRMDVSSKLQSELDETRGVTDALRAKLDEKKVFSDCDQEAKDKSREALAKKIEVAKVSGAYNVEEYQKAYDLGLHLKDDYNYNYENCLRRNGVKY